MKNMLKILFVEDVMTDAELIWRELNKNNVAYSKLLVDNRIDYIAAIKTFNPDIVISDYSLPQFYGMEALAIVKEMAPFTPFILVTGSMNEDIAVQCMKAGADDYIIKQNLSRLVPAINSALNKNKLLQEKDVIETALRESYEFTNSLLKSIPFGMDIVDNTGAILFMSENFKNLFGEHKRGAKCWELYRDNKKQCINCPLLNGITIGKTEVYESHGVMGGRIFEIHHTGIVYKYGN